MKRILSLALFATLATACGEATSIQTGEVGKQLSSRGLEAKTHGPGTFRLDSCFFPGATCSKIVRAQVNLSTQQVDIEHLFLPKSSINVSKVQIALQFRVKQDNASIDKVFAEVRPEHGAGQTGETDRVLVITDDQIFATYLQRIAPNAIVAVLREHTVDEILSNVPEISEGVRLKINEMLARTPIEVTEVGFPNGIGQIPALVIEKMHQRYAVDADRDRRIKQLEADLAVETQRQAVQHIRTINNQTNAATAGLEYSEFVQLQALDGFADAALAGTPIALGTGAVSITKAAK